MAIPAVLILAAIVCVSGSATTQTAFDVTAAKQLVNQVRTVTTHAKEGMLLKPLHHEMSQIKEQALVLRQAAPGSENDIECGTTLVLKLAAAATGSHEVLNLLFAQDNLSVLNGRLSLSLAIVELIAQQLQDELTMSGEVGPQLAALSLVADTVQSVIRLAPTTVAPATAKRSVSGAFSLVPEGLMWQSVAGFREFRVFPDDAVEAKRSPIFDPDHLRQRPFRFTCHGVVVWGFCIAPSLASW